jgi:hypothetical protein
VLRRVEPSRLQGSLPCEHEVSVEDAQAVSQPPGTLARPGDPFEQLVDLVVAERARSQAVVGERDPSWLTAL